MKVVLGMSGGVDSSVSALLLKKQGYEVIGVTMSLCGCAGPDAELVCKQIGIEHRVLDETVTFKEKVIDDFIYSYSNCKTPNPCIECNKYLKFGVMYSLAKSLNAKIATGHYAKTEYSEKYGRVVIKKAASENKDQSYVLYNIDKEVVKNLIFPLSNFQNKEEIRKIARENNLKIADKPDSEDICFIPDGDYKKFLEKNSKLSSNEGNIVYKNGEILGRHSGLYKYTIGQRKGLGIAHETPLFVLGFNPDKNELIVGEHEDLFKNELTIEKINLLAIDNITNGMEFDTKIRYAAKPVKSKLYNNSDGTVRIVFSENVRGITPGQSAVFYDEDVLIGGGKIR